MAENQVQAKGTNGFAIASLILSIVQLNVLGIIFGFVALNQIKKTGENGKGLAIAGIIIGFISVLFWIIFIIWWVWFFSAVTNSIIQTPNYYNDLFNGLDNLNITIQ